MRSFVVLVAVVALGCGGKKKEPQGGSGSGSSSATASGSAASGSSAGSSAGSAPAAAPDAAVAAGSGSGGAGSGSGAAGAPPPHDDDDLLAIGNGTMVIDPGPGGVEHGAMPFWLIDEDPATGWVQDREVVAKNPNIVFELADKALIKTLVVDAKQLEIPERLPDKLAIDVSNDGPTSGWKRIAEASLTAAADDINIPVTAEVPGRWVRLTVTKAGSGMVQLMELRAYGKRLDKGPMPDVTGSYKIDFSKFFLSQQGATVTGCYEFGDMVPVLGVMDGRTLKFELHADGMTGPTTVIFSGNKMFGGTYDRKTSRLYAFEGTRTDSKPGPCPDAVKKQDPLAAELVKSGHVALPGINFDTDSDKLRPEAKATIDRVVALLKADAALKLRVEGHTDSTSTAEHNQKLSEQRAAAVVAAIVAGGIDAKRLEPKGFGQTKPVAPNTTELGRAQNRRVELAKP